MALMKSALGGIPVSAAMMTTFETVAPGDSLDDVTRLILSGAQQDFPVMEDNNVVGVVTRDDLLKGLAQKGRPPVSEFMHRDIARADASDMLESALQRMQESACHTMPVLREHRLVGLLTAENLGEFLMIRTALNGRKAVVSGMETTRLPAIKS